MFAFFVHSLTAICARLVDNLLICERVNVDLMLPQLMVQNIKIYQPKCPLFFYASSSSRFSMVATTLLLEWRISSLWTLFGINGSYNFVSYFGTGFVGNFFRFKIESKHHSISTIVIVYQVIYLMAPRISSTRTQLYV